MTRSPGVNGPAGTKLAPRPSECGWSVPWCAPLTEPVTVTVPTASGATPRKLISVPRWAARVPGAGNAFTAPACAFTTSSDVSATALVAPPADTSTPSATARIPLHDHMPRLYPRDRTELRSGRQPRHAHVDPLAAERHALGLEQLPAGAHPSRASRPRGRSGATARSGRRSRSARCRRTGGAPGETSPYARTKPGGVSRMRAMTPRRGRARRISSRDAARHVLDRRARPGDRRAGSGGPVALVLGRLAVHLGAAWRRRGGHAVGGRAGPRPACARPDRRGCERRRRARRADRLRPARRRAPGRRGRRPRGRRRPHRPGLHPVRRRRGRRGTGHARPT